MGEFLDGYDLPKLNEDEINNLYTYIITNCIEEIIKSLHIPKTKHNKQKATTLPGG